MLTNKCYLKDIREFEEEYKINILKLFEKVSIENIMLLLSVLYRDLPDDEKYKLIDDYLETQGSLVDLIGELRNIIIGYDPEKYKNKNNNDEFEETDPFEDVTQYKYLHEFYMHLCMQLMSLGMTYTEFWSLTTKEMYQAFESIKQKMVLDYNKDMRGYYMLANMVAGAVWGKGMKEPPQIKMEELLDPDEEIETPYGKMTREDYKSFMTMENYMNKVNVHNKAMEGLKNG